MKIALYLILIVSFLAIISVSSYADECNGQFTAAATPNCYVGTEITSQSKGDDICRNTFGEGWRWAEWHDYRSQGYFIPNVKWEGNLPNDRMWVWINDQEANCFNNDYGMTWGIAGYNPDEDKYPVSNCLTPSCGAKWNIYDDYIDPDYSYDGTRKCNAYTGDTPCEMCRQLLCVKPLEVNNTNETNSTTTTTTSTTTITTISSTTFSSTTLSTTSSSTTSSSTTTSTINSSTTTTTLQKCTDSDGGKNYYVKGMTTNAHGGKAADGCSAYPIICPVASGCGDGDYLIEWYCNGDTYDHVVYECPYFCEDGACTREMKCKVSGKDYNEIIKAYLKQPLLTIYDPSYIHMYGNGYIKSRDKTYPILQSINLGSAEYAYKKDTLVGITDYEFLIDGERNSQGNGHYYEYEFNITGVNFTDNKTRGSYMSLFGTNSYFYGAKYNPKSNNFYYVKILVDGLKKKVPLGTEATFVVNKEKYKIKVWKTGNSYFISVNNEKIMVKVGYGYSFRESGLFVYVADADETTMTLVFGNKLLTFRDNDKVKEGYDYLKGTYAVIKSESETDINVKVYISGESSRDAYIRKCDVKTDKVFGTTGMQLLRRTSKYGELLLYGNFTNHTKSKLCKVPKCKDKVIKGYKDGCPVYACISIKPQCPLPTCKDYTVTGKDENGCSVYSCSSKCHVPSCDNYYSTGEFDGKGCPIYKCPTCGNGICEKGEKTDCPVCTQEPCPLKPCKLGTCPQDCDTCNNGVLDNGEEDIDCGGNCKPCEKHPVDCLEPTCEDYTISGKDRNGCPIFECDKDITLEDYPDYLSGGAVIVTGSNAPGSSVIGAKNIGAYLADYKIVEDKELRNTDNLNIISIGDSCQNGVTAKFEGYPKKCNTVKDKGVIKIKENGKNKAALLVYGSDQEHLLMALNVLINYQNYDLKGKEMCVTGTLDKISVGKCKPELSIKPVKDKTIKSKITEMKSTKIDECRPPKCNDYKIVDRDKNGCPVYECKCDGCLDNGKCYTYGYRLGNGRYCSDNGNFIPQKESNERCINNFECASNVCANNKCISGSIWNKLLKFLGLT